MPHTPSPSAVADPRVPSWWPADTRGRLLATMAVVVSERGYVGTRVSDVLERTGISRRTFYAHFANREDCFLTAYDVIAADVLSLLPAANRHGELDLPAVFERLLAHFAAWPEHARILLTEAASAGPSAVARHERTVALLCARLVACPSWQPGDCAALARLELAQALLAAIARIVERRLAEDDAASLPELASALSALITRVSMSG